MTTIKQPTPEEINEAAEKYAHESVFPPQKVEYSYSLLSIMKRQKEAVKDGFLAAVSWLQNYQAQQRGAVRSADIQNSENVQQSAYNYYNSHWKTEQPPFIASEPVIEAYCQGYEDCNNQFQTPASGGSNPEMKKVEQAASEQLENDAKSLLGRSSLRNDETSKTIYVLGAKFGASWQLRQSSQPQPNAISVIEEYKEDLDKELRGSPSIQFVRDYQVKSQVINDLLTKLKP